jgi:hypothetical protein
MPDARGNRDAFFLQLADVLQRLLEPATPKSIEWFVGEGQHVEAARHEVTDAVRVRAKIEGRTLLLEIGRKIVAVRHHRLDVHEIQVAVDLVLDARRRLGPRLEFAAAHAVGFDRLIGAIEPDVADERDGHLVIGCSGEAQTSRQVRQRRRRAASRAWGGFGFMSGIEACRGDAARAIARFA